MERIVVGGGATVKAACERAAFYDLDGTLVRGNVVDHYIEFAAADRTLASRARRILGTAARAPLYLLLDALDRRTFNEVFYRSYEGISDDRLAILGREIARRFERRILDGARDLVDGDRMAGFHPVLVSGAIEPIARPLAEALGIDEVFANRLEIDGRGLATGRLLPPVLAGPEKARIVRAYARERGLDLERCRAYSDDAADLPLLSAVGQAIAVNPDLSLRATARSHRWPVVELDGGRRPGPIGRAIESGIRALEGIR